MKRKFSIVLIIMCLTILLGTLTACGNSSVYFEQETLEVIQGVETKLPITIDEKVARSELYWNYGNLIVDKDRLTVIANIPGEYTLGVGTEKHMENLLVVCKPRNMATPMKFKNSSEWININTNKTGEFAIDFNKSIIVNDMNANVILSDTGIIDAKYEYELNNDGTVKFAKVKYTALAKGKVKLTLKFSQNTKIELNITVSDVDFIAPISANFVSAKAELSVLNDKEGYFDINLKGPDGKAITYADATINRTNNSILDLSYEYSIDESTGAITNVRVKYVVKSPGKVTLTMKYYGGVICTMDVTVVDDNIYPDVVSFEQSQYRLEIGKSQKIKINVNNLHEVTSFGYVSISPYTSDNVETKFIVEEGIPYIEVKALKPGMVNIEVDFQNKVKCETLINVLILPDLYKLFKNVENAGGKLKYDFEIEGWLDPVLYLELKEGHLIGTISSLGGTGNNTATCLDLTFLMDGLGKIQIELIKSVIVPQELNVKDVSRTVVILSELKPLDYQETWNELKVYVNDALSADEDLYRNAQHFRTEFINIIINKLSELV